MSEFVKPRKDEPGFTKITRNAKGEKLYKVKADSSHRFSPGTIISRKQYDDVRKKFDVVINKWTPGDFPQGAGRTGRNSYYISGKKQQLVKDIASEHADNVSEQKNYIRAVGNDVRPYNIVNHAKKFGTVLFVEALPKSSHKKEILESWKTVHGLKDVIQ